jgi:hypothetical protein
LSAAAVGQAALAVVRFVERCGGRTTIDALDAEFIARRGYYPEDLYTARAEAEAAGLLVTRGSTVEATS